MKKQKLEQVLRPKCKYFGGITLPNLFIQTKIRKSNKVSN